MTEEHEKHSAHHAASSEGLGRAEGNKSVSPLFYFAIAALVVLLAFNQFQISSVSNQVALYAAAAPRISNPSSGGVAAQDSGSSANLQAIADRIIPTGVPAIYGKELGVSFDDPVGGLPILAKLDTSIALDAEQTKRYTRIALQISCEYCCGADSIVFPDGKAACGCQHSYAMRGLAKYLVTKHGTEFSDDQILEEMGKLKTLYFPKQILTKALSFASAGMDANINTIDLTSNKYRNFKPSSSSGAAGIANAPDMVGGC